MKVFIVAVPLFDSNMAVQAYRLCDRSGETTMSLHSGDFRRMSESLRSPGLDLLEQIGVEPFAVDKPLMIDVNRLQLLTGFPSNMDIDHEKVICTLPGDTTPDKAVIDRCKALREIGYKLALNGFPPEGLMSRLLHLVDYVVLSCNDKYFDTWHRLAKSMGHVRVVVSDVPDQETFERLSAGSGALFTGSFYNQPITKGVTELSPVKITALQLLNMVNTSDFELQDLARIIERDPYLTISLLRFINRGGRLRNRVDSIVNAVAILGQREVKRWATVAISVNLANDRPGEITKLSLVRAKFAENLATAFSLGVFQPNLFMVGLFSLIDIILEKPMPEAIAEVAVDKRVRDALVSRTGELAEVMELIYVYERADWDAVSFMLIRKNISIDSLNAAFVDAMIWYHALLSSIDEPVLPSGGHNAKPMVTQPSSAAPRARTSNPKPAAENPYVQPIRTQPASLPYIQPTRHQSAEAAERPYVQPIRPQAAPSSSSPYANPASPQAGPTYVQPIRPQTTQQRTPLASTPAGQYAEEWDSQPSDPSKPRDWPPSMWGQTYPKRR